MSPTPEPDSGGVPVAEIIEALRGIVRRQSAERAALGDVHAQFCLGDYHRDGSGGPQDDGEALRWYRTAADRGYAPAECRVGEMYEAGRAITLDIAEAVRWYRRSAEKGYANAQFRLGLIWAKSGSPPSGDPGELEWYRRAAAPCEDQVAIDWYTEAAEQENEVARSYLATTCRKAADRGDADAQCRLASMYQIGSGLPKDDGEAERWYRKAANQWLAEAQYNLAADYVEDPIEQAAWYRRAADQGYAPAQSSLGLMYHEGRGVERDESQAIAWLRKAAEQGTWGAPFQLGLIYHSTENAVRDPGEAARWFRIDAERGHTRAQACLGNMYRDGEGLPRDPVEAAAWYRRAAEGGDPEAQTLLAAITAPAAPRRGRDRVAGMRELKTLLRREVVDYVRNPERYRRYGLNLPNGILLYGPPGCGKTYIARLLAEELGHHFVEIVPSDLASPYIHETVTQIRAAFSEAAKQAPSVMFIDEFEAFVPPRGDLGGHQQHKAAEVNEFLVQLNCCSEKKILVIAATNQPEKIDPAVRRAGRLDKHIYVGPPDPEARREMLSLHLEGRPVAPDLDLAALAAELDHYSASDLKFLVDQAARRALEADEDIGLASFRTAMRGITPSVRAEDEGAYRTIVQRGS